MLDELRCGENVQNRQLGAWRTEAEYEGLKAIVNVSNKLEKS